MKHGVTPDEAKQILIDARIHAYRSDDALREISYQMAVYAIREAKRIGAERSKQS